MRNAKILIPVLAATALLAVAAAARATTVEESFDQTYPLQAGGRLSVANVNGRITVATWNRAEVRVEAVKKVRAGSEERAAAALEEVKIEIDQHAGGIDIKTHLPRSNSGWLGWMSGHGSDAQVSYTLTVPAGVVLDARTVNGSIDARGASGELRFDSTNGNIEVSGAAGSVDAGTTNGNIEVELTEVADGAAMRLSTTNGGIRLTLPESARASLSASTTNGSITSDLPVAVRGRLSRRHFEGDINGGGGSIRLSTTNGSIRLLAR